MGIVSLRWIRFPRLKNTPKRDLPSLAQRAGPNCATGSGIWGPWAPSVVMPIPKEPGKMGENCRLPKFGYPMIPPSCCTPVQFVLEIVSMVVPQAFCPAGGFDPSQIWLKRRPPTRHATLHIRYTTTGLFKMVDTHFTYPTLSLSLLNRGKKHKPVQKLAQKSPKNSIVRVNMIIKKKTWRNHWILGLSSFPFSRS